MKAKVVIGLLVLMSLVLVASAGRIMAAEVGRAALSMPEEGPQQALLFGAGRSAYAKFVSNDAWVHNANPAVWATALSTVVNLSTTGCVTAQYSGEATAYGALPNNFQFRATVGGLPMNFPYVFFDASHTTFYDLAAFTWWKCNIPPGNYTVAVQFKPYTAGDAARVRQRTLMVEY